MATINIRPLLLPNNVAETYINACGREYAVYVVNREYKPFITVEMDGDIPRIVMGEFVSRGQAIKCAYDAAMAWLNR